MFYYQQVISLNAGCTGTGTGMTLQVAGDLYFKLCLRTRWTSTFRMIDHASQNLPKWKFIALYCRSYPGAHRVLVCSLLDLNGIWLLSLMWWIGQICLESRIDYRWSVDVNLSLFVDRSILCQLSMPLDRRSSFRCRYFFNFEIILCHRVCFVVNIASPNFEI